MHRIAIYLGLYIILSSLTATVCLGESLPQSSENSESYQLEQVVVTAQKKEEDVQEIPVSATVLSGDQIEDAMIEDTIDLSRMAPNVHLRKSTSENVIIMRGITSFETSIYSPTAVYVDDLMVPMNYGHLFEMVDTERVEVLRGPQGSLYGGNSLAGVINIITKKPDNERRLKFFVGSGSYTGVDDNPLNHNIGLNVATPLIEDKLYLSLAGSWKKSDGFIKNLYFDDDQAGAVDRKYARAILRWTPTQQWDISFSADILNNDDNIAVYRFDDGPYRTDPYTANQNTECFQKETGNSQNLRVAYTGNRLKFLSATGFRNYNNENLQDYDCTADPMYDYGSSLAEYDDSLISQEFRLSSTDDGAPFKWLVGVYGFMEDTTIKHDNEILFQHAKTTIDTKGCAAFGEGTYTLFDRLHATAGLRFDYRKADGERHDTDIDINNDIEHSELVPKASVGYDLTDNAYCYATVSKGFLAGGFNYSNAIDEDSFVYDPEYTWNYELGIKTSWFNNRLQANLTLFYIDMTDKQTVEMNYGEDGHCIIPKVDNAAKAHSQGVELELRARPARGWDIYASFGYTHAEYDQWIATEWNDDYTDLIRNDYSGKTVPSVPEYTGRLGLQYRHANGLFARADLSVVGPIYADQKNRIKEDAYALVNLQLGYEIDKFAVVLWGKNVFNTEYHTAIYDWDGYKMVQDGDPAIFGIRVTLRF